MVICMSACEYRDFQSHSQKQLSHSDTPKNIAVQTRLFDLFLPDVIIYVSLYNVMFTRLGK